MKYISTRGQSAPLSFQDAVITGLAPDGGLLVPESIPNVSDQLNHWSTLSYTELAYEIFHLYTDFSDDVLKRLINDAYATFEHPEITPTTPLGNLHILELFHGPTLAFKDVAMQFLSQAFDEILTQRNQRLNILGSTSGDTGSAAIYALRGKTHIQTFMMHPKGRTSPLQEKQMTSVLDKNVFNLAIEGTFDDCQGLMKSIFCDTTFKTKHHLGAVNSVNWCRIMAQIVYYFYSGLRIMKQTNAPSIQFSVPTGNFGNILAGFYAARMGLPIEKLILATNENDILSRFFNTGTYTSGSVTHTISPSMDIQVASNFERYLYMLLDNNPNKVLELMNTFEKNGAVTIPDENKKTHNSLFLAQCGTKKETLSTIADAHKEHNMLLDPHTAVGVQVAKKLADPTLPCICLATAHPAKFTAAVTEATGITPTHPTLDALANAETRCQTLPIDESLLRTYIESHTSEQKN